MTSAQSSFFWDADGPGGVEFGGTGIWNTSNSNWRRHTGGFNYERKSWQNGASPLNKAIFNSTSGTVTLESNVKASTIEFDYLGGYVLTTSTAKTLTLENGNTIFTRAGTSTIENIDILGISGLYKTGAGTLDIDYAGTLSIQNSFRVSNGRLNLKSGTTLDPNATVLVGFDQGGSGIPYLDIQSGATLIATATRIGYSGGDFTEVGGTLDWGSTLTVGVDGEGTLTVNSGGVAKTDGGILLIGDEADAVGTVNVSGEFGNVSGSLDAKIGNSGEGELTILSGGEVTTTTTTLGTDSGSSGIANVAGDWTNSSWLRIGSIGEGTLNLQNGGVLTTGEITLGHASGGTGTLNIGTGGGAGLVEVDNITGGPGTATVRFNHTDTNHHFTSNGTSSGDAILLGGALAVKHVGSGTTLFNSAHTYTGSTAVTDGTLKLTGAGTLGAGNTVTVGASGNLDFNSINHAISSLAGAGDVQLGSATLTVGSANTNTTFSGVMSGTGKLTKTGTGKLTVSGINTYSGATDIQNGEVEILAGGSLGDLSANLTVGHADIGSTTLTVDGTALSFNGLIGSDTNSNGSATISDTWNNDNNYVVGGHGTGDLTVANTGEVTMIDGYVGRRSTGTGTVTLQGEWDDAGITRIGTDGHGTFTLYPNAQFHADGGVLLAENAGSTGTLNIGHNNGDAPLIDTPSINGGNGTATLNLNHDHFSDYYLASNRLSDGTRVELTGSLSLNHLGDGTTILKGANSYTGDTTVSAGTLRINSSGGLGNTSSLTVSAGGTLDLDDNDQTTGVVSGGGAITLGSGTLTADQDNNSSFSGIISGTGGLTKSGTGQLSLAGANTYSGNTTISEGILRMTGSGGLADTTSINIISGATFDLNGVDQTVGSLAGAGNVTLGTATLTTGGDNSSTTLSGNISEAGNLLKTGTGTSTLSGVNSYDGTTTVGQGSLQFTKKVSLYNDTPNANWTESNIIVESGATAAFNVGATGEFSAGNIDRLLGLGTASGGFKDGSFIGIDTSNASGTFALISAVTDTNSNSNSIGLTKLGSGTLQLTGANTFSGATTVSGGTLQLGSGATLTQTNSITLNSGSTLDLNDQSVTVGSVLGDGAVTLGSGTLSVGNGNETFNLSAIISGTGGLTKNGSGVLTLDAQQTYTGGTNINAGTLRIDTDNRISDLSATTITSGATFDLNNHDETIGSLAGAGNVTLGSGTLTTGGDGTDSTFSGVLSGTGGLTKTGDGNFTLSGANTYIGNTSIQGGALSLAATGTITDNHTDGVGIITIAPGSGQTATLNIGTGGAAPVIDPLAISGGSGNATLAFNHTDTNYFFTHDGTSGGTKVDVFGDFDTHHLGSGTTTVSELGDGAIAVSAGELRLRSNAFIAGVTGITVETGATFDLNNVTVDTPTLTGAGDIQLGSATLHAGNNSNFTFDGSLSGTGKFNKEGGGVLTLSGVNTYSGDTTITNGTLRMSGSGALADTSDLYFHAAGTFDLNDTNQTVGSLEGDGEIRLGSGTLTLSEHNTNLSYFGVISGSGGLTKEGTGRLFLGDDNTYTGATTVSAGTLLVGSFSSISDSSALTVGADGIFDLGGGHHTIASLAGAGAVDLDSGTLNTGGNNSDTVFSGVISGSGNLNKQGTGIFTLSGANTYTGTTTITDGTLRMNGGGDLADGSRMDVKADGTWDLNNIDQRIRALEGSGNITLGSATLTANTSGDLINFEGIISGTGGFTKTGSSTLMLSGANTYTGATSIDNGTLRMFGSGKFSDSTAMTVASGATFDLSNKNQSIGSLSGAGDVTLGTAKLTTGNNDANTTFSGVISGSGKLTKEGSGVFTLSNANTYTGDTTIDDGTLRLSGGGDLNDNSAVTIESGANFELNNIDQTIGSLSGAGNVALGTATLTTGDNDADTTLSGIISGSGELTKEGTGIFTIGGVNTYTGATTINQGTLQLSGSGNLADSTAMTVANGATFDLNDIDQTIGGLSGAGDIDLGSAALTTGGNDSSSTFSGTLSGTGGLTKIGTGTFNLSGANTYTGDTHINTGTLRLNSSGDLANSTAVTVDNGATFDLNDIDQTIGSLAGAGIVTLGTGDLGTGDSANTTYSGVISGSGNLTKRGSGTFTLSGVNTYTGNTVINAGTLQLSGSGDIIDTSEVEVESGATFDLNDIDQTIGNLTGAGDVALGSASLTTGGNDTSSTLSGTLSGTGSLTKEGTGTFTLSGGNTYTGDTHINTGTLKLSGSGSLDDTTDMTIASNGTFQLTNQNQTINSLAGAGEIKLGNATLSTGVNEGSTTFSGDISGSGGLTKIGTGVFTLSGTNTFSGATLVDEGTLQLNATDSLSSDSATTVNSDATLDLNDHDQTIGSLAGLGDVDLGSGSLKAGGDNTSTAFAGVISGSGGFTKKGTGTFTLSNANTYTGATNINNGTLQLTGSGDLADATATTISSGATLDLNDISQTIGSLDGAGDITLGTATLTTGGNHSDTLFSGVISGTGGLTKTGTSTFTLSDANTYTGATHINQGTLKLSGAADLSDGTAVTVGTGATFDLNNIDQTIGSLDGAGNVTLGTGDLFQGNATDTTFSGGISGTGRLIKQGTGTTTLSGTNTNSGATVVNAGTLQLSGSGDLADTSQVNVKSGAIFDLNDIDQTFGNITGAGHFDLGSAALNTGGNDASSTLSGILSGTGSLTKDGTGTLTFSGANTYTGATTINQGTLKLSGSGDLADTTALTVASGATFDMRNIDQSIGSLAGAGSVKMASADLTTGRDNSDTAFSGVISGPGNLTKVGTGSLTLSGANTFGGTTTITAGTLQLSGDDVLVNTSGVTISDGATLGFHIDGAGATASFSKSLSGDGDITKTGSGALTLSGNNTRTGRTDVSEGSLIIATGGQLGTGVSDVEVSSENDDTASLTIQSGSTVSAKASYIASINSANNSADVSGTWQNQAIMVVGGYGTGDLTIQAGGEVSMTGSYVGRRDSGIGTVTVAGTWDDSGTTRIGENGNGMLHLNTGGTLNAGSQIILANNGGSTGTLNFGNGAAAPTLNTPTIHGGSGDATLNINHTSSNYFLTADGTSTGAATNLTGSLELNHLGTGTTTLLGANTYSGNTNVLNGTLRIGAAAAFSPNTTLNVAGGATFDANGFTAEFNTLEGTGDVNVGSGGLTVAPTNTNTFTGRLTGSGGLTKEGAGTLELTGNNTYAGLTRINGGRLRLTGSAPNSAFRINAGGILSGSGQLGGLTIGEGGILSPGNSPGTLSAGDTVWETGGEFLFEIDTADGVIGTSWDLLDITGTLTINADSETPFSINLDTLLNGTNTPGAMDNFDAESDYSWTFVQTTDGITFGTGASIGASFTIDSTGFANTTNGTFAVALSGNNLALNYTATSAVPEPDTFALLFGAFALAFAGGQRRTVRRSS